MAWIEEHDGYFLVRWRDPDGSGRKRRFKRKRAAEDFKDEVHDVVKAGKKWQPSSSSAAPRLGGPVTAYLEHVHTRMTKRTLVNVGTALDLFAQFLGGDLDKVPLTALTHKKLEGFYEWLRKTPGRHKHMRALDTCAKYVSWVQVFWRWAANQDEWANTIPRPRKLDALPRDARKPTRAPTWAEMDAAISEAGSWYPLAMGAMRALGLRVSQVMGLKVGDVRVVAGGELDLYFRGELGKSRQERSGRIVPIGAGVAPLFKLLTDGRDADAWLIPSLRTGKSQRLRGTRERDVQHRFVNGAWERAVEKHGVREEVWKGRPDHAFRKGFATGLRGAGADGDAVEFLVGHSLALKGIYIDADGLGLRGVVALIPPFSAAAAVRLAAAAHECLTSSPEVSH
jgi:integrase